uniref:Uncharacterized protein n=1 Tax=Anopheles coluzzii TaxID=1518534 RepID=A0A8W7PPR0_ANOCL
MVEMSVPSSDGDRPATKESPGSGGTVPAVVPADGRPGRRKPFFEKFGTLLKQRSDAFLLHVNSPVPPHGEESDTPPPANGTAGPGGGGPAGPSSVAVILGPAGILGPPIATNGDASPGKLCDAENYNGYFGIGKVN